MADPTDFLYPMVDGEGDGNVAVLLEDLAASARSKGRTSAELRLATLQAQGERIGLVADAIVERLEQGGRVLTCGNGGSATDAQGLADLLQRPPQPPSLSARCLASDVSVVTALANDIGVDEIFSRQLQAHGRNGDVLVALSTSGDSTNLLRAAAAARTLGILTVGVAGNGGGSMASTEAFDHVLTVEAASVHRVQEAQSALCAELARRCRQSFVSAENTVPLNEVAGP